MFLRLDVESLTEIPEPKSHVVPEDQVSLPEKPDPDIAALANLATEMHRELQRKDQEISQLNFQLGKYQEIAKNSVPLLEAKRKEQDSRVTVEKIKNDLHTAQNGRFLFFILFALSLGVIGVLANYIFLL